MRNGDSRSIRVGVGIEEEWRSKIERGVVEEGLNSEEDEVEDDKNKDERMGGEDLEEFYFQCLSTLTPHSSIIFSS